MRATLNRLKLTLSVKNAAKQRLYASLFVAIMLFAAAGPAMTVYAAETIDPATLKPLGESSETAADVPADRLSPSSTSIMQAQEVPAEERVVGQDEYSQTILKPDGTYHQRVHQTQQRYKEAGEWVDVDTSIVEDNSPYEDTNIFQRAWNNVWGIFGESQTLTVSQNQWQARFAPTDHDRPAVEIEDDGRRFSLEPKTDRVVIPRIDTDERGVDFVVYDDIWPGVNLVYEVRAKQLKEYIVVKDRQAQRSFEFGISNVTLKENPELPGSFVVEETGGTIAPLSVSVWGQGPVFGDEYISQTLDNGKISVGLNSAWVDSLNDDNFPLSIDPTYDQDHATFGTRASGNYHSFKVDGAECDDLNCYPQVGSLLHSGSTYKAWRAMIKPVWFANTGQTFVSANLHLSKMPANASSNYMGTTANRTIWASWGDSMNFDCCSNNAPEASGTIGTSGNINVTNVYKWLIDNTTEANAWLGLYGQEGSIDSFKALDPDNSYVDYYWSAQAAAPTHAAPADKAVLVATQPSLRGNTTTDPNGDALQYQINLYSDPTAQVGIANSGVMSTPQWTVPQGVLQDGVTYYWRVFARDYSSLHIGNWAASAALRSFKVDMRNGKDSTQSYDSVGPVNVDLATGNVTTGAGSHSISALGGNIGVGLEYNTPSRSQNGVIAEYWNGSGLTGTPDIVRAEEDVNFSWLSGSPDSGGVIGNDNFSARFSAYFVSPVTGSIQFGSNSDDSARIWADDQLVFDAWNTTVNGYGSALNVTAGQIVKLKMEYKEATSTATARLQIRGIGPDRIIPSAWLQTGPRPVNNKGLTARYYIDDGSHTFSESRFFMQRQETKVDTDWSTASPVVNGPADNFMVRYTGYFIAPQAGSYVFGAGSDDGSRLYINGSLNASNWNDGAYDIVYDSPVSLTQGQAVPITFEFYEKTSTARVGMYVRINGAAGQVVQPNWLTTEAPVLPDGWDLSMDSDGNLAYDFARVLSHAVTLYDASGSTHEYKWDTVKKNYIPPTGEAGVLTRNGDGSVTLQDIDGRTYVFNADGTLREAINPADDRKPAALKYDYEGTPARLKKIRDGVDPSRFGELFYGGATECGNPPAGYYAAPAGMLCAYTTTDGQTTRFHYDNSSRLAQIELPGGAKQDYGYDQDGRLTAVRDALANDAAAAGVRAQDDSVTTQITYDVIGRASAVTAPAANAGDTRQSQSFEYRPSIPAIALDRYFGASDHISVITPAPAGYVFEGTIGHLLANPEPGTHMLYRCKTGSEEFTSASSACEGKTVIGQLGYAYDAAQPALGTKPLNRCRVIGSGEHFDSSASNCEGHTFEHLLGHTLPNSAGIDPAYTLEHVAGAAEPNGYSQRIEYDAGLRTVKAYDALGLMTQTEWHAAQDLVLSTTDPTSLKSTTIYDHADRPIESYGPAPSAWFGSDRKPLAAYASQVPRTDTAYDGGIQGLEAKYFSYATSGQTLFGAPKLHSTGLTAANGDIDGTWPTAPITTEKQGWGIRLTGRIKLNETGTHTFRIDSDDGARLYIDDKEILSDWTNGAFRAHPSGTFAVTSPGWHKIRVDYYNKSSSETDGRLLVFKAVPGGSLTRNIGSLLTPDYGLATFTKTYDSVLGNATVTTNYGSNPELGLAQSSTTSGGSLSFTSSGTYEAPGDGYLRKLTSTKPGGGTTTYSYYGDTETKDNPCTTSTTETYRQGGQFKTKTTLDPDDSGSLAGITTDTVYNDAGDVVAERTNDDPWTCTTYDARGRVTQIVVPDIDNRDGRTITYNYAVNNNPLIGSITDSATGVAITLIDLLGRAVSGTDTFGYETTLTYDSLGRVIEKESLKGVETVVYDNHSRVTEYKLDNVTYAVIAYDAYGRISTVNYPTATNGTGNLELTEIKRDTTQELKGVKYTFSDSTTYDETVTRTIQTGIVTGTTTAYDGDTAASTYQYDAVGRLTGATIDNWQYAYEFGAQDAACASTTGYNSNANKNGNRTKTTVTNTLTSTSTVSNQCYNFADQLVSSSDAQVGEPTYDSHGNVMQLDGGGTPIVFAYNASDQNISITQGDNKAEYTKDADGAVLVKKEYRDNALDKVYRNTSGVMLTCNTADENECAIADRYIALPGGVALTLRNTSPTEVEPIYSIQNFHGDTALTVGEDGLPISSVYMYDPFGQPVASGTFGTSGTPNNATGDGMGWATSPTRKQESLFSLAIVQMGARVYIPTLGRFIQVDPTEGGTPNAYTYVLDPINYTDYNGQWGLPKWVKTAVKVVVAAVVVVGVVAAVSACVASVVCASVATAVAFAAVAIAPKVAQVVRAAPKVIAKVGGAVSQAAKAVVNKLSSVTESPYKGMKTGSAVKTTVGQNKIPQSAKGTWSQIEANGYQSLDKGYKVAPYKNSTGKLPAGTKYTEFYLNPRPNPGPERIIRGSDGNTWYTPDHYETFIKL